MNYQDYVFAKNKEQILDNLIEGSINDSTQVVYEEQPLKNTSTS